MPPSRPVLNRRNLSRTPTAFDATLAADPPTSAQARLLAGAESVTRPTRPQDSTTATVAEPPGEPGKGAGSQAPGARHATAQAEVSSDALPRWAWHVVIGGVLLAVGMPVSVLISRSMLAQSVLSTESSSKADMVCTSGEGRAQDGSDAMGWLFGGSYFHCSEWETHDARLQRERAQYEANYLARQRARQGLGN